MQQQTVEESQILINENFYFFRAQEESRAEQYLLVMSCAIRANI